MTRAWGAWRIACGIMTTMSKLRPERRFPRVPRDLRVLASAFALLVALVVTAAPPVAADWLVTTDGDRIETEGPWKVDGRKVVFTLPGGTLSMMRLSEVDLEASEAATEEALRPPEPEVEEKEPEAPREPVLVLTNADIPQGAPALAPDAAPTATTPEAGERNPLQVVRWRQEESPEGGIELIGTVRNMGQALAADIRVGAAVKDSEGEVIGRGNGFLDATSLVAGRSTEFRVLLPTIYDFVGEPEFTVEAEMLEVGSSGSPTASGSAAGGSEEPAEGEPADSGEAEEGSEEGEGI